MISGNICDPGIKTKLLDRSYWDNDLNLSNGYPHRDWTGHGDIKKH